MGERSTATSAGQTAARCCVIGCDRPAAYEIVEQGTDAGYADAYTHACEAHVGELLGHIGKPTNGEAGVWWHVHPLQVPHG